MNGELEKSISEVRNCLEHIGRLELEYLNLQQELLNQDKSLSELLIKFTGEIEIHDLTADEWNLIAVSFTFAATHTALLRLDDAQEVFKQNHSGGYQWPTTTN